MADIKYDIVEEIGVLSENAKGWRKELNKIAWNGAAPKYDIRDWAPEHEKMGKGITLTEDEAARLKEFYDISTSIKSKVRKRGVKFCTQNSIYQLITIFIIVN